MVNYKCNTCKHVFNQKSNYDKHINKKNKCKQVIINTLQCIYCDGIFIQHKELISHIKYNCNNKLILLQKENEKLKKQNNTLIIKGNNNNNVNNSNNINITITPFGKEDYSEIKDLLLSKISGFDTFFNLLNVVHCNKELPQYNNIYSSNIKSNIAKIFDGKQIKKMSIDEAIKIVTNKQTKFIGRFYDELALILNDNKLDILLESINALETINGKKNNNLIIDKEHSKNVSLVKKQLKRIKIALSDNKDLVLDSLKYN